jgi:hypothetical protein
MIESIRRYLYVLLDDPSPDLGKLVAALDSLAVAYGATPQGEVTDPDVEPPATDDARLGTISQRFPGLDFYAVVDPVNDLDQELMLADPYDDLADIARDLMEALWHWDNVGEADGRWAFRFGYETHWGGHLRDVQRYLFQRLQA